MLVTTPKLASLLKRTLIALFALASILSSTALPNISTPINDSSVDYAEMLIPPAERSTQEQNYASIWHALRSNFTLGLNEQQPAVQQAILWYTHHPRDLQQTLKNGTPYLYAIFQATRQRNMPAELALLPMIESAFRIRLQSGVGASGLWQFMASTGKSMGLTINRWYDGRNDITQSTDTALDYLVNLHDYLKDWLLTLAAYDWGVGNISNQVKYNIVHRKYAGYWSLHLPHETQRYVPRLLAFAAIIQHPENYNITLPNIPYRPVNASIVVRGQIDLDDIANIANIPVDEFLKLNAAWKTGLTNPSLSRYTLLCAINNKQKVINAIKYRQKHPIHTWQFVTLTDNTSTDEIYSEYNINHKILMEHNPSLAVSSFQIKARTTLILPSKQYSHIKILHASDDYQKDQDPQGPIIYPITIYDTLPGIAKKFNVTVDALRQWNHLDKYSVLGPLQRLKIFPHVKYDSNADDTDLKSIINQLNNP